MSETSDEFGDWWNGDYDDSKNPYREGSPAYWAWAGWEAAVRVNAITEVQRLGQEIQPEKD